MRTRHAFALVLAAVAVGAVPTACAGGTPNAPSGAGGGGAGGATSSSSAVATGGGGGTSSSSSAATSSSSTSGETSSTTSGTMCTGACLPGAMDQQSCPWGAPSTRTCMNDCTWGAWSGCTKPLGWRDMASSSTASVPARSGAYAFWTGSVMLVWGGSGADASPASYDPDTDTWKKLAPGPSGGQAVWTGAAMVVITGDPNTPVKSYDPSTDTWTTLPGMMPLTGRSAFALVAYLSATNEVMGWGGDSNFDQPIYTDGAAYSLTTHTWRTVAASPLPGVDGYKPPGAVWAGTQLVVYGGGTAEGARYNAAATYDPVADQWTSIPSPPAAGYTFLSSLAIGASDTLALFWSGDQYGGFNENYPSNNGAFWDTSASAWTGVGGIPSGGGFNGHESGASFSAATAFGVWGGRHYNNGFSDDGAGSVFDLATATWTDMAPGGPTPRQHSSAVWTGTEAIIWAGQSGSTPLADGKIWRPCDASGSLACNTNLKGICAGGTYACNGGTLSCVPAAPQPEVCDGLDNDCNGVVDDAPLGAACSTGLQGVCATGAIGCVNGATGCVQTVMPSSDICDGLDNDCNGAVDDGLPMPCSTGKLGICDAGQTQCANATQTCVQVFQQMVEVCNGVDDDCNGIIDDNPIGVGFTCATGLPGACANGTAACINGGIACVPPTGC